MKGNDRFQHSTKHGNTLQHPVTKFYFEKLGAKFLEVEIACTKRFFHFVFETLSKISGQNFEHPKFWPKSKCRFVGL